MFSRYGYPGTNPLRRDAHIEAVAPHTTIRCMDDRPALPYSSRACCREFSRSALRCRSRGACDLGDSWGSAARLAVQVPAADDLHEPAPIHGGVESCNC